MAGTGGPRTPIQRAFGDRIRTRRHELGLSQEALALRSGLHRTYIGSLEAGERNPSLRNVVRLAQALEIDAGQLIKGLQQVEEASAAQPPQD